MKPTGQSTLRTAAYVILYGASMLGELHADLVEFIRNNPDVLLAQPKKKRGMGVC
jgi:hypothetical protein